MWFVRYVIISSSFACSLCRPIPSCCFVAFSSFGSLHSWQSLSICSLLGMIRQGWPRRATGLLSSWVSTISHSILLLALLNLDLACYSFIHLWHAPLGVHSATSSVDISLQSWWFWATSIASFRERLLDFKSCWIVFIHIVWGHPGGLRQFFSACIRKVTKQTCDDSLEYHQLLAGRTSGGPYWEDHIFTSNVECLSFGALCGTPSVCSCQQLEGSVFLLCRVRQAPPVLDVSGLLH